VPDDGIAIGLTVFREPESPEEFLQIRPAFQLLGAWKVSPQAAIQLIEDMKDEPSFLRSNGFHVLQI
jgi:hypothetical protein